MKTIIALISVASCVFGATARTETTDTVSAQALQEVVVEAPKVVRKSDMDIYHPSKSAIEHSQNGLQLLNNLMIPTLSVNDALGQIKAQDNQCRYA